IHGRTAPPKPEIAKTHLVSGDPWLSVSTYARARGKIGASIKPAKVALRTIARGTRLRSNSTAHRNAAVRDDVRSCASDSRRTTIGTSVRPQRSATQKQDVAMGAHALLEIGRRPTEGIIPPPIHTSVPTYKKPITAKMETRP